MLTTFLIRKIAVLTTGHRAECTDQTVYNRAALTRVRGVDSLDQSRAFLAAVGGSYNSEVAALTRVSISDYVCGAGIVLTTME